MTVPAQDPVNWHTANGVTTVFAYQFRILSSDHLEVYVDDVLTASGFTVSGVGSQSGGNVTFDTAPASGSEVLLIRNVPSERTDYDYQTSGDFIAATVNNDFDQHWMFTQQLLSILNNRALLFPKTLDRTGKSNALPAPVDSHVLYWDNGELKNIAIDGISTLSPSETVKDSLSELLSVTDPEGKYFVYSYHAGGMVGGGTFKYDATMAQTEHDGGTIIAIDAVFPTDWTDATELSTWFAGPGTGTGCFVKMRESADVYISEYGARPLNELQENRHSIQACIDYCTTSGANFIVDPILQTWDPTLNGGSGGYVNRYFGVGSFHPDYVEGCCLVFEEPRNFFIFGNTSRVSSIRYYGVTAGQCVVKLGSVNTTDWGYVVDGLGVSATADETDQAGCVLDYAVYGRNTTGLARCTFRNCTFSGGLLRAAEFHGYMIDFQQVEVKYGQAGGLRLDGPSNLADGSDPVTTSITLQNVWARQCGGTGIRFRNQSWYVNLISCGVDGAGPSTATSINRPEYAYEFGNVRGMTMMSCGAEEVDRYMRLVSCDSVNIIGPKGTGWGKTDGTVADYAIEITGNGTSVNISGWPKGTAVTTGTAPTKKYNYVLGVTKSDGAMGNLLVQIMDNGINYLETYYVANSGTFTIPIVWPNDTADGAHRAQRKTGNTTWPNKDVIISPADGQWGTDGCLRKVINITGETTASTHQILMHYGGNNATTYTISVTLSSQAGATAAKWDGVANVTASGKNITYFTKTSGNSAATPTLAWNGDALEYNAGVNFFESIIEVIAYSNTTVVSTEFLK